MTTISTMNKTLILTIRDEDHPITLQTEVETEEGKIMKEYILIKKKSGALAVICAGK